MEEAPFEGGNRVGGGIADNNCSDVFRLLQSSKSWIQDDTSEIFLAADKESVASFKEINHLRRLLSTLDFSLREQ